MRVLIIEPEQTVRDVIALALEQMDMVVHIAHGADTVSIRAFHPDYILVAHQSTTTKEVQEQLDTIRVASDAKVIILTTAKLAETKEMFRLYPVLSKPFTLEDLNALLNGER